MGQELPVQERTVHDVAVASGMTVDEVWAIPDDGRQRQLIDGELFVTPAPRPGHQQVLLNVLDAVRAVVGDDRRVFFSPVDVVVGERTVVQPDLVVFSPTDSSRLTADGSWRDAPLPELVVEVSSPNTRRIDLVHKRRLYERVGIREYWFVDREAAVVDVYAYGDPDDLRTASGDAVVPSALLPVAATVADLLAW